MMPETQRVLYQCSFPNLPTKLQQTMEADCAPEGTNWERVGKSALGKLQGVPYKARVALTNVDQQYSHDICAYTGKKKVIVRLSQGVYGHVGENDFRFNVQINGGSPLLIKKKRGLLHDDILICTDDDRVNVKVTAIEKDLFFRR